LPHLFAPQVGGDNAQAEGKVVLTCNLADDLERLVEVGLAPAEPAEPTTKGISSRRAARNTLRKSRFAPMRVGAILPAPR
jgi:hypothetical protein